MSLAIFEIRERRVERQVLTDMSLRRLDKKLFLTERDVCQRLKNSDPGWIRATMLCWAKAKKAS